MIALPKLKPIAALIQADVCLAPLTTFRVGGPAEWYCEPQTLDDLKLCLSWAQDSDRTVTFLGAGSNLLISDAGLAGLVINTRKLRGVKSVDDGQLWVAAGESISKLSRFAAKRGWRGLEWAVGIPGSIGGAVVMNAGAHGAAIADHLVSATVLDEQFQLRYLTPEDLQFQYRYSVLQSKRWLVTGAYFRLEPGCDPASVEVQTEHNWASRQRSQPYHLPSCGSVFRNPESYAAGWLIEQTGLKGHQIGGAQVAERHANFILNYNHATATDIHQLIHFVQDRVFHEWSLTLEPEVRILGHFEVS